MRAKMLAAECVQMSIISGKYLAFTIFHKIFLEIFKKKNESIVCNVYFMFYILTCFYKKE